MATIQGVYLALFGRPADPTGLAYFNGVTRGGTDLSAIGDLSGQQEYVVRYQGQTNEQIINSIYQNLFGRDAEASGVSYWAGRLNSGDLNTSNIAIAVLDGSLGSDKTIVDNKLVASDLFTSHLNLQAEVSAYSGLFAESAGRDFLDGITTDPSTIPDAAVTDQQILFLFRDGNAPAPDAQIVGMSADHSGA